MYLCEKMAISKKYPEINTYNIVIKRKIYEKDNI